MIRLENLTKIYRLRGRTKVVADDISVVFPTGSTVAILGRNGAGKSTLLQMIAGSMEPDAGRIVSDGSISWPVGFTGSFHPEMSGAQNTRFLARVYGVDTDELCAYVEEFAELGGHFYLPVRSYSSGMRARLAFGVSMGIRFDTYLVDEVTAVGDAGFRRKSEALFTERMKECSAIMVTHALGQVKRICDYVAVLENGRVRWFEDPEEGVKYHRSLMKD